MNLLIDPTLPVSLATPVKRTISDYVISIRWENVTAAQAMVAILDNYGLALVQEPGSAAAKIAPKPPRNGATPGQK